MRSRKQAATLFAIITFCIAISGCMGAKIGSKHKGEVTMLSINPGIAIDTDKLQMQMAYNDGKIRGDFFDPTTFGTTALSIVATGVKKTIDNEKKKYQASYEFNIASDRTHKLRNDSMYFYSKKSQVGPFDVKNMQFTGFTVCRLFGRNKKDENKEMAMRAFFELDTSNLCEIAYDGVFRLKLKEFEIHYAKAKIPHGKKKINLDIQVQFLSSYISKEGQFYPNAVLGTFTKTINGVVLQDTASFHKFEDKPMDGWSFVVPRSYYHSPRGDMWNQGSYSIKVTVKETSKQRFVNQLASAESSQFIDATTKGISVKSLMEPDKGSQPMKVKVVK
jgi:hypothetical protein